MLMNVHHGSEDFRLLSIGTHAHGLVLWHDMIVTLDSEGSALVTIHPSSRSRDVIWKVSLPGMRPKQSTAADIQWPLSCMLLAESAGLGPSRLLASELFTVQSHQRAIQANAWHAGARCWEIPQRLGGHR